MILPICDVSHALEMLLLLGLQKEPMGNITAAIQILGLGFFSSWVFLGVFVGLGVFFLLN